MKPIRLEIVTRAVTLFNHCNRCAVLFDEVGLQGEFNQKALEEYPQDLKEESLRLFHWIRELARLYRHRLQIKLIDAQSIPGLYKALRHRVRKYPAFIIEGKEKVVGWDRGRLEAALDRHIQASIARRKKQIQSLAST